MRQINVEEFCKAVAETMEATRWAFGTDTESCRRAAIKTNLLLNDGFGHYSKDTTEFDERFMAEVEQGAEQSQRLWGVDELTALTEAFLAEWGCCIAIPERHRYAS